MVVTSQTLFVTSNRTEVLKEMKRRKKELSFSFSSSFFYIGRTLHLTQLYNFQGMKDKLTHTHHACPGPIHTNKEVEKSC